MIGAGSLGFTRRLVADLLTVPELGDTEFWFMDIDKRNLDMVAEICRRDISKNGVDAKIICTQDRIEAVKDADYVTCTIRHGGLDAFRKDIEVPLKYGVDQCVGDTLCAGGLTYAQRHIPELLSIAKDIEQYAKKDALFMNYANPMSMNTWALEKYANIRHLGLCHGVEHGFSQLCKALEIPEQEADFICAGINHQTWYIDLKHKGKDMKEFVLEAMQKHENFSVTEKVRIDVLKRFGYYSTESNGHLSEYLPWYRKRPEEVQDWIGWDCWINGETGGYLRICEEGRDWFEKEYPKLMEEPALEYIAESRSAEHFSHIIEAEVTGRIYRGHFNVKNESYITNLPEGCIVEIPCFVDRLGIHPQRVGDLPLGCAGILRNSISVQELGMEAAVHGNIDLFKQALLLDPLTASVCNTEEIWQMGDELIVETSGWLPQYSDEVIEEARVRLRENPPSYDKRTEGVHIETKEEVKNMHESLELAGKGS